MSARSLCTKSGGGLEAPIFATRSLDGSAAMSTKATLASCAANASTIAAPMPDPPPVMKTTLSISEG